MSLWERNSLDESLLLWRAPRAFLSAGEQGGTGDSIIGTYNGPHESQVFMKGLLTDALLKRYGMRLFQAPGVQASMCRGEYVRHLNFALRRTVENRQEWIFPPFPPRWRPAPNPFTWPVIAHALSTTGRVNLSLEEILSLTMPREWVLHTFSFSVDPWAFASSSFEDYGNEKAWTDFIRKHAFNNRVFSAEEVVDSRFYAACAEYQGRWYVSGVQVKATSQNLYLDNLF
jgi:hypothetical protein